MRNHHGDHTPAPTRRRTRRAALMVCLLAAMVLTAPGRATAADQVNRVTGADGAGDPVVTGIALSATTLDVRKRGRPLTVTVQAEESTDPVREITRVRAELLSPALSRKHRERSLWITLDLTDGTATDGTWSGTGTVPRWTIPGLWQLAYLTLQDAGGGVRSYRQADMADDWQTSFTVLSEPDITRPILTAFTFSPRSVDTRRHPRPVRIRLRAKDSESGVGRVYVGFEYHDITPDRGFSVERGVTLTKHGRWWKGVLRMPMWVGRGKHVWHARVRLFDRADNSRTVSTARLRARGAPVSLTVRSRTDSDLPTVTGLSRSPASVEVSSEDARVRFTVRAADRSSGAQALWVTAQSPSGARAKRKLTRADGPRRRTSFTGPLRIPQGSAAGDWTLSLLVVDLVGNRRSYTAEQLADLGLPSTISVTSG